MPDLRSRRPGVPAWQVHTGIAASLVLMCLMPATVVRMVLCFVLGGASPLLASRRCWSPVAMAAFLPAAAIVAWSTVGFAMLWCGGEALAPGALAVPGVALALRSYRVGTRLVFRWSEADAPSVVVGLLWSIPVMLVAWANRQLPDGTWMARNWWATDGYYLVSLAEQVLLTRHLPVANPFVAGVANYYASLLHAGVASIATQGGMGALPTVWWLAPLVLVTTVMAVCQVLGRGGRLKAPWRRWQLGIATLLILLLRSDLFVYPQTQFLGVPVFLLALWMLGWRPTLLGPGSLSRVLVAVLVLVFGHAISAASAIVSVGAVGLLLLGRGRVRRAMAWLLPCLLLGLLFLRVNSLPVSPAVAMPDREGVDMLLEHLRPWALVLATLVLCAWLGHGKGGHAAVAGASVALLGVAYLVHALFLASPYDRWFVMFNAERFFLMGLFPAWGLLTRLRGAASWAVLGLVGLSLLGMPPPVTMNTHSLVTAPPEFIDPREQEAISFIRKAAGSGLPNVFMSQPQYAVSVLAGLPQFTFPAPGVNLWAHNTLPDADFNLRQEDYGDFERATPQRRLEITRRHNLRYLLIEGDWQDGARAARVPEEGFPPGSMKLVFHNARWIVLAPVSGGSNEDKAAHANVQDDGQ